MKYTYYLATFFCLFFIKLSSSQPEKYQVVILGSGPAGLTAAIYSTRAGMSTLVLEGNEPGGQITLSYLIENFPGFPKGINGYELFENMREQAMHFGAKVESGNMCGFDLSKRPFILKLEDQRTISADTLIVATGSTTRWLGLDSEKELIGKGVSSCAVCDGSFYKNKEVVVVGGGDTALEDALYLTNYCSKVTVIHRKNTLKASKHLQDKAFANEKIHFLWNHIVLEIKDPLQGSVSAVIIKNLVSEKTTLFACEGVFVAIGHEPQTKLFEDILDLDETGCILTKPFSTSTNVPGVFVAGDVAANSYRQAVTAAASGCMSAIDAYHFINKE